MYDKIFKIVRSNSITKSIINLDNSLSDEDLASEIYLKLFEKDEEYLYNKVRLALIDIYRKVKKNKALIGEINSSDIEIVSKDNIELNCILKDELDALQKHDNLQHILIYEYFILNMTYREIAQKNNMSIDSVKRRIDKALKWIRNNQ